MKNHGGLSSPFHNPFQASVDAAGNGVAERNGYDMRGGEKGTAGKMSEVTTVTLPTTANLTTPGVSIVANQK